MKKLKADNYDLSASFVWIEIKPFASRGELIPVLHNPSDDTLAALTELAQ
ncbi:MAG: hypothetical protein AAGJ37_14885 [Pseudomonadota bacterium]